jgi:hypothetical protein
VLADGIAAAMSGLLGIAKRRGLDQALERGDELRVAVNGRTPIKVRSCGPSGPMTGIKRFQNLASIGISGRS